MFSIELNGTRYQEGSKCPSCSSERDKGGRLEIRKKKNLYLTCARCKYTIHTKKAIQKKESFLKKLEHKTHGIFAE